MSRHTHHSPHGLAPEPETAALRPEASPAEASSAGASPAGAAEADSRPVNSEAYAKVEFDQAGAQTVPEELAAVKKELAELNDKYLRKLAEEVNFRKRMMREKDEAQKYGLSSLLRDIIPVLDDFDRAIASAEIARNYDQLHDGVVLIRRQLHQMLENKYHVKKLVALGALFDPNLHEALSAEPGDVDEATVIEEFLPGYVMHDRVLRSAKVKVCMPSQGSASGSPAGADKVASGA